MQQAFCGIADGNAALVHPLAQLPGNRRDVSDNVGQGRVQACDDNPCMDAGAKPIRRAKASLNFQSRPRGLPASLLGCLGVAYVSVYVADRKSVVSVKSVSVRVDLGGCRILKQKKKHTYQEALQH